MKFDRYLLPAAILFFLVQLLWLAAELQFIEIPGFRTADSSIAPPLGKITSVHNSVRRRPISEIVWSDGRQEDVVKAYDAILTLSNSATKIQLKNGTELSLAENTLVFLEPVDSQKEGKIRIRFAHGSMRSRLLNHPAEFEAQSWVVTADEGSELQIKSVKSEHLELEIIKGKVVASQGGLVKTMTSGEVVKMEKEKISPVGHISNQLKWPYEKSYLRYYFHRFPGRVRLTWTPDVKAQELELMKADKSLVRYHIAGRSSIDLDLQEGSYEARLSDQESLSQWLRVDVWRAPTAHLMMPLPRDRFEPHDALKFIWLKPQVISKSQLEMSESEDFESPEILTQTGGATFQGSWEKLGKFYWRVVGYDSEGFEIPAPYSNPIYLVPDALAAPVLKKTEATRTPAEKYKDKKKGKGKRSRNSSWLRVPSWWIWFMGAPACAKDQDKSAGGGSHQGSLDLRFSWQEVLGAEHYILEISESPDFRKLLLEKKVRGSEYIWRGARPLGNKFYWRVASGASGRMGRFSESQEVDLASLQSGKEIGNVEIVESKQVEKVVKKHELKAKEKAIEKKKEEPRPSEVATVAEPEVFYQKTSIATLRLDGGYEVSSYQQGGGITIKTSGVVSSLELGYFQPFREKWRTGFLLNLQQLTWKSSDEAINPDSLKLQETRVRTSILAGHQTSPWFYTFDYANYKLPMKTDVETVSLVSYSLIGAGIGYDSRLWANWIGKSTLKLLLASSTQELSVRTQWDRLLIKSEKYQLLIGGYAEAFYYKIPNFISGSRLGAGLSLGINW